MRALRLEFLCGVDEIGGNARIINKAVSLQSKTGDFCLTPLSSCLLRLEREKCMITEKKLEEMLQTIRDNDMDKMPFYIDLDEKLPLSMVLRYCISAGHPLTLRQGKKKFELKSLED